MLYEILILCLDCTSPSISRLFLFLFRSIFPFKTTTVVCSIPVFSFDSSSPLLAIWAIGKLPGCDISPR